MNGEYAALAGRIREELIEIERVADRAGTLMTRAQRTGDDGYLDGVALNLHGFYAGMSAFSRASPERWRALSLQAPAGTTTC